jgi:vancomycin resistance protein YoaR
MYYINNFNSDNSIITIPTTIKTADEIDIEKIYSEVYKEAQDAYYTTEPFAVYTHVDGVDFAISIEEAKALLQEDNDSYTIPLKYTTPAVTVKDLGAEAFPNLLATYTTTYSTTNVNRSTNIRLASEKINGTVLMPGETFSYNTTVGQRTAAAGFKEAAVYAGGEVTTGIGGGICQVSSTLYNTVLLSNLEIVERTNHGFNPGYVPAGRDATVSWGGPDFKFKNTRNYPIKIVCTGTNGKITAEIYGFKEENEYEVEITSYITSYIQYKTITKEDSTLAVGTTKVTQSGSNGCKSVAYRILKQNGQVISKTLLSTDTYNPHNKIISVGTKAVSGE